MKYIRTENGVYEVVKLEEVEVGQIAIRGNIAFKCCESPFNHLETYEDILGNVIAQADTPEELCDEFVGVDNTCENGHQLLRAIPYKCANYWNGGVYGAIWTSKGLIYVAKMNEKGELELI